MEKIRGGKDEHMNPSRREVKEGASLRKVEYQRTDLCRGLHCEMTVWELKRRDGVRTRQAALPNNWPFCRAGSRGQESDLDKLTSCGAPQRGHATSCRPVASDRKPWPDIGTMESFFSLRWAALRRQTESRHCVVSKISHSSARFSLTFSLPVDAPLASSTECPFSSPHNDNERSDFIIFHQSRPLHNVVETSALELGTRRSLLACSHAASAYG